MLRDLIIPVSVLTVLCSAFGQNARRTGGRLEERFNRFDRNGDGVLSAAEARRLPRFKEMDADNDGKLTLDEIRNWRRAQRNRAQQPGAMDGDLPEDDTEAHTIFQLAYIHKGSLAQASALVDVFGNEQPDILIACKRRAHLVKNNGTGSFAHAETYDVDNANGWGSHDFNGDGRLDAFVAQQQREQDDCWINNGNGTFTRRNLGNETVGNTRNVLFADFDGDGNVDSYHSVSSFGTNHAGCELHPGKANGTFGPDIIRTVLEPDVPGFWYATATHPERGKEEWSNKMFKGAVVRDFDGDGKPDIVTAAYADRGFQEGDRGGVGQQWVNQQDRGLFVLHNRSKPGRIRFTEVARQAIGKYAYGKTKEDWNCYSVIPLDYDRDGDPDLFVGAVTRRDGRRPENTRSVALYENVSKPGEIRFVDRTDRSGFGRYNKMPPEQRWQINFASGAALDYDNDGWVDLCLINRRDMDRTRWPYPHLFRNNGKGTFVEVPAAAHGIGGGAGGRDLNYADLDGDGRLDVIIHDGTVGGYDGQDNSRIYMNRLENRNRWIGLKVVRGDKATPAIGARVVVYKAGTKAIVGSDEVRTDFCYRSKRPPILHFGLGQAESVDVHASLPGVKPLVFKNLTANRVHTLRPAHQLAAGHLQENGYVDTAGTVQDDSRASCSSTGPGPLASKWTYLQVRHRTVGSDRSNPGTKSRAVPYPDIRYARTAGVPAKLQSLDIYTDMAAENNKPRPVLIMIHGGGWRRGDKASRGMTQHKVPHFVGHGYVYVSINYRLSDGPDAPKHPAHVQDCAKAIAWVHDNIAKYGGDPDRLYVMGHSAGAHLAALVSTDHRRLKAEGKPLSIIKGTICLDTAAYDIPRYIDELGGGVGMRQLYENAFGTTRAAWKDASPRHHVAPEKGIPPILFFHTGKRMAGEKLSKEMVTALVKAGTPAQTIHAADKDHAGINHCIGQPDDPYTRIIMQFLADTGKAGKL